MAAISKEEENYVRMALLLTGPSSRAVRVLFNKIFPPASLQSTLNQQKKPTLTGLRTKKIINQGQWDLMFPSTGVADSKNFDVTLMFCLIKELSSVALPAVGLNCLPSPNDTTPGDDLVRIKFYRNKLAHLKGEKVDNSYCTTAWNNISDAVGRLGGSAIYKECQDLRTKILDQSNHEIMLEIRNCMEEVNNLKKDNENQFKELSRKHKDMEQGMAQLMADLECNYKESEILNVKLYEEIKMLKTCDEKNSQAIRGLKQRVLEIEKLNAKQELNAKEVEKLKAKHEQMGKLFEIFRSDDEKKTQEIEELNKENEQLRIEKEKLKADQELIKKEIENLKETVPRNIREQISKTIENWKEEDQMFVATRAASHVLECIKTNSCVTITASSGVGKTFTVRHIALQMADDGYDIVPVTNPEDIVKYHNPNKKTLYVIDDLCGTYTLNQTYLDKWKTMHKDITGLLKNDGTKIIASCRLQVYQDEQFKLLPLFTACECNLLLSNMSLSRKEKRIIAKKYLKSDASKIKQYIDLFDFLPLLCKLFTENKALNIVDFFENPFSVYEKEIDKLNAEKAYGKYCALALCVMFNNHLREEWFTDDENHDIKQIIKNTCEACRLDRGTSRLVLKDELDSLIHTFLKKEQGCYLTIHDKLFDFLSFYFGKTAMIQCIIKHGDRRLISERLVFKNTAGSDQFTTIVPNEYQKLYIKRMFDDWFKGELVTVFNNINMKSPEFRYTFLMDLEKLDIAYQKQLACKFDKASYEDFVYTLYEAQKDLSTFPDLPPFKEYYLRMKSLILCHEKMNSPLLHWCALGDVRLVEWCCSCGADVNYCSNFGFSPLYVACARGYTDIVNTLVDNNADINKCSPVGESPLYIACIRGYTDIVTKLVDNNADINKCVHGDSPLYIACKGGYTDIVAKLVDKKADINNCTSQGESPLYIACKGGYTDIVAKLVEKKADINKCTSQGESPLLIACKGGYTDIVTKLVDKKADINKCTRERESPLYIACKTGYTDIVAKLVDNKADINKCTDGESPLYVACKEGYTDIVTKLVDNEADIYMPTRQGESPLYIACKHRFKQIVKILIKRGAKDTNCGKGQSPQDIARLCEHNNLIEFIMQNFYSSN